MEARILLARIDQAPLIAATLRQAFLEYEALYTPEAFAATTPTTEKIQKRWNEGPVWTAIQSDEVIGTVAAVPKSESIYIRSMAISPTARGHGIGKSLLQVVEQFAIENDLHRMFLSTTPFLHRAIGLYKSFGFKQTGEGPHELFGTPLITMKKELDLLLEGYYVT